VPGGEFTSELSRAGVDGAIVGDDVWQSANDRRLPHAAQTARHAPQP
jgi:hypothetical protein